jgi:hypothetical protein
MNKTTKIQSRVCLTGMDWNEGSWFLAFLKWLGLEEVVFGLIGMACNGGSRFGPFVNSLEWRKSVLVKHNWLGMDEVSFGLDGTSWNGRSRVWAHINVFLTNVSHSVKLGEA